jgi:hypothetical protein
MSFEGCCANVVKMKVFEMKKPLINSGFPICSRCGRDSSKNFNCHIFSIIAIRRGGF